MLNRGDRRSRSINQRGAAAVEFGLCFLLVFGIVYAIFEFGRVVYSYNVLAGATREASRYAMVHGLSSGSPATTAQIRAVVTRWAVGLDPSALNVVPTWTPNNSAGSVVRVVTTYTITPYTRLILGSPLTLGSRSEMMISQ